MFEDLPKDELLKIIDVYANAWQAMDGEVEYSYFAKTIDPMIKTRCVFCPPDDHPEDAYCRWEFTLE